MRSSPLRRAGIVVDTTVPVYAVGTGHPTVEPCRRLIELCGSGAGRATTTAEVIQEFAHVRGRQRPRSDAVGLARDYAVRRAPLAVVDVDDLDRGLDLFEQVPGRGAFDAVPAAALVSADRNLGSVPDLYDLDPMSPSFENDLIEVAREP